MRLIIASKFRKKELKDIALFVAELQRKRTENIHILIQCGIDDDLSAKDVKNILDKFFEKHKDFTTIKVKKDQIDEFITKTKGAG